jgi:ribosome-binding factor A
MGLSMPSHRGPRMGEAIREVVASAILFEAADPRIRAVTVLRVEVSADFRQATVYVSVMGTEAEAKLALRGLKHAAGFFQSRVADRLQTRFTPVLSFKLDDSVKKSVEISRLIDEAIAADRKPDPSSADESAATEEENEESPGEDAHESAP